MIININRDQNRLKIKTKCNIKIISNKYKEGTLPKHLNFHRNNNNNNNFFQIIFNNKILLKNNNNKI